jgi:hypothetical protein
MANVLYVYRFVLNFMFALIIYWSKYVLMENQILTLLLQDSLILVYFVLFMTTLNSDGDALSLLAPFYYFLFTVLLDILIGFWIPNDIFIVYFYLKYVVPVGFVMLGFQWFYFYDKK